LEALHPIAKLVIMEDDYAYTIEEIIAAIPLLIEGLPTNRVYVHPHHADLIVSRDLTDEEYEDMKIAIIDVEKGFKQLETEERTLLLERYMDRVTLETLAAKLNMSLMGAKYRVDSALKKLQKKIG
jgi:DNA-directed RNA polymerase specialized sigma24 family protein